ncbi:flagellar motor protein MotA [Aestuariivirga sp.]|uniref:flagellar motor protein MotA n=1 Tax=Aestuariivirga sp. TaxID=2650926 RepID=UPI0039E47485
MAQESPQLEQPMVHLVHMAVFTLVVAVLVAVIYNGIKAAFMANPFLNGLIVATLLLGMVYAYRMVWRLMPEVNWVNNFRLGESSEQPLPILLGPMATMLGDADRRTILSPSSMRSLLDSLASRLDEARDLMRYLVGLLIFLGLLGTFWGLLETVSSVGDAIRGLDVSTAQSSSVFEELKNGLQRPLAGMGLSFSSSLFGLSGSLILGFMDLKASQAQNRFYQDLEDWLSTITDLQAGTGEGSSQAGTPAFMRIDMQGLQRSLDRLAQQMSETSTTPAVAATNGSGNETIEQLADAVASLVAQMRDEQKMVRNWIQTQQVQQSEIQRLLIRQSGGRSRE